MRLGMTLATVILVLACSTAGTNTSTLAPSIAASATATNAPVSSVGDVPPAGLLAADGDPVTAFQGTYCWNGMCADVFDTPPAEDLPLLETSVDGLTFSLAGAEPFLRWSASYRSDDTDDLTPLAEGGSDFDPDTSSTPPPALIAADFSSPPKGDWLLIVQTFFVEGDAQYMWHVVVE